MFIATLNPPPTPNKTDKQQLRELQQLCELQQLRELQHLCELQQLSELQELHELQQLHYLMFILSDFYSKVLEPARERLTAQRCSGMRENKSINSKRNLSTLFKI